MKLLIIKNFLSFNKDHNNRKSKLSLYLNNFSVFITILSIIFIVLIISVNDGFKLVVNNSLINFNAKYKITNDYNQKLTDNDFDIISSDLKDKALISKLSSRKLIVKNRNFSEPVNIIAFSDYNSLVSKIEDSLVSGTMSNDKIIIGQILSERLNVDVGSQLIVIDVDSSSVKEVDMITVGGVFNTNIPDYDRYLVYGNRALFRKFIDNDYDYFLTNYSIENNKTIKSQYNVNSIYDLNRNLFNWLRSYDTPIKMLIIFILIICIFNILQNNFLYISSQRKNLYLLKTMGLSNLYIYLMILLRSFFSLSISCLFGFTISYFILIIESNMNFIKLPKYVYFTNILPVSIDYNLIFYIFPLMSILLFIISIFFYFNFINRYEF
tara:strand:+ start:5990 stop:7132 length:1143 start_codon:yes stop_codon:yes gene_type:complete